ncbi:MAG: MAPEG family protein [Paracoccaceae bacterium]
MQTEYALLTVALYTGLNGLILLWLAANVIKRRGSQKVSIGDGGNKLLTRAMRGQANFVEYVPMALIVLLMMEMIGTPAWVLHIFGLALTASRLVHAWHFVQEDAPGWQRYWGTVVTFTVLGFGCIGLIAHTVAQMI